MKYKIGETVRIRPDLKCAFFYGNETANKEMASLKGCYVTINGFFAGDYIIREDEGKNYWTDEMLTTD